MIYDMIPNYNLKDVKKYFGNFETNLFPVLCCLLQYVMCKTNTAQQYLTLQCTCLLLVLEICHFEKMNQVLPGTDFF